MTIGPAPIIRTVWMSLRLGMQEPLLYGTRTVALKVGAWPRHSTSFPRRHCVRQGDTADHSNAASETNNNYRFAEIVRGAIQLRHRSVVSGTGLTNVSPLSTEAAHAFLRR